MIRGKSLIYNVLANFCQALVGAALSFLLYRYINEALGVALLGVWSVVLATASTSRLADLGLSTSVTRFVALYLARSAPDAAAHVIETAILSLVPVLALFLPFLYWSLWYILPYLFDADHLTDGRMLLPYALVSLALTMVALVVQSGLDGCQRMDLRAKLAILSQILMVVLAFLLIPRLGLIGLAWAQIGQGTFLLLGGWWLLRRQLRTLARYPRHWSRSLLREMLGYGANIQIATLCMLAFDPLTKALMARFGGATAAGYFEMANQVVLKVRALIVTANQAIIPRITQISEVTPDRLNSLYCQNLRTLIFVAFPAFSLLYVWSGLFSWLLVGNINGQLVFLLQVNIAAWLLNLFAAPAYFANMGTGSVGWNTLSHFLMSLFNAGLGWTLGQHLGLDGVAWAYASALVLGSWFLVGEYHRRNKVKLQTNFLSESGWLIAVSICAAVIGHRAWGTAPTGAVVWILMALTSLSLVYIAWRHPFRLELWKKLGIF